MSPKKKEKKPKTNDALKLAHTLRLRRTTEAANQAEIGSEADLLSFRLRKVCVRLYRGSIIKPMRSTQVCHTLYVCKQELGPHTHSHSHAHSHSQTVWQAKLTFYFLFSFFFFCKLFSLTFLVVVCRIEFIYFNVHRSTFEDRMGRSNSVGQRTVGGSSAATVGHTSI